MATVSVATTALAMDAAAIDNSDSVVMEIALSKLRIEPVTVVPTLNEAAELVAKVAINSIAGAAAMATQSASVANDTLCTSVAKDAASTTPVAKDAYSTTPVAKDTAWTNSVAKAAACTNSVAKDAACTKSVAKDASPRATSVAKGARARRKAAAIAAREAAVAVDEAPMAATPDADDSPPPAAGPLELYLEADESGALTMQSKAALLLTLYPTQLPCLVRLVRPATPVKVDDAVRNDDYDDADVETLGGRISLVKSSRTGGGSLGAELPALACPAVLYAGLPSVARALAERGGPAGRALFGAHGVCLKACKERSRWTRLCEVTCPGQLGAWAVGGEAPACLEDLELALARPGYKPRPHLEGWRPTLVDVLVVCYLRDAARSAGIRQSPPPPLGPRTAELVARLGADPAFAAAAAVGDRFPTLHRAGGDGAPRLADKRPQVPSLCTDSLRDLLDRLEPGLSLPWDAAAPPLPPLPDWLAAEVPPERAARKREQLASLAAAVLPLARPGHVIVDFCSGSGYLGLLLAHLLPGCSLVLVENKLESLQFALGRVRSLGLANVRVVQSNLCSFRAAFDIGAALHACGSASDLVLDTCARAGAACVLSPCCHGATKPGPGLDYPRSAAARAAGFGPLEHAQLCHAADRVTGRQSRQLLARRALQLVDSDRAQGLRECGYSNVRLALMRPETCSPKNSIIIASR